MKNIYHTIALICIYALSSCADKLETFDALVLTSKIQITGIDNSTTIQKGMGDVLEFTPVAKLEGEADDFTYTWYRLLNNQMRKISEEQHLRYVLDTLGTQQYRLEVNHLPTNTKIGLIATVNVTSKTQNGWYVLKEDAEGNTDMDLVQLQETSLVVSQKSIISTRLGRTLSGSPLGFGFTTSYFWDVPGGTAQRNQQALIIKTTRGGATYRPTDARIMTSGDALFYENPVFYYPLKSMISTSYQHYDISASGRVPYMRTSSGGYLPPRTGTYELGPCVTQPAVNLWNDYPMVLAFDESKSSFVYLKRDTVGIAYFPNNYISGVPQISSNNMNGKVVFLENTAGGIDPAYPTASAAYGLFQENNQNARMKLYGFALSELNESLRKAQHSPIVWEKTLSRSTYAALLDASFRTLDKSNPVLYFQHGNKIGYYDIKNDVYNPNWYSINIPGDVTYFKFLDVPHPTIAGLTLKHLVVGYHSNQTYQIVKYQINGSTIKQDGDAVVGEGKVGHIFVASNNATNMNTLHSRYH